MNEASLPVTRRRILVVEDDAVVARLIGKHLSRLGHTVVEASRAEDALALAARVQPEFDAVLTDVHLPGSSGVELVTQLALQSPLRPVIVITGDGDAGLAADALRRGAAGYLLKPFHLFELDAVVAQAIGKVELLESIQEMAKHELREAKRMNGAAALLPVSWLALAEQRCGAGAGHGERVLRVMRRLAAAEEEAGGVADEELVAAAQLHEIGRLFGATSSVLLPAQSAHFLRAAGYPRDVVLGVRHMREHWSGQGGPDGLSGSDIPMLARLLAVADAVDHLAMHSMASGVTATLAVREAMALIASRSGSVFSPSIVRALEMVSPDVEAEWVSVVGESRTAA